MDMLRTLKREQEIEAERLGNKWHDTDRLFVKWDGQPMHNNTPYFWFKEFCGKHELRFCDIHSMRHRNNMKTLLLNLKYINKYISLLKRGLLHERAAAPNHIQRMEKGKISQLE